MKKFLLPLFTLVFLIACEKESSSDLVTNESFLTFAEKQQEFQLDPSQYFLDIRTLELEKISMNKIDFNSFNPVNDVASIRSNPNSLATGRVTTQPGTNVTFSAIQNNGGIHGQANTIGNVNSHVDIECLYVSDNKGYFGGVITQSDILPVGWYIYYGVEDNGEGRNADPDRYTEFFILDIDPLACESVASFYSSLPSDPFIEGAHPTQVQVK